MANTRPNKNIPTEQENPLFHDTWKLLAQIVIHFPYYFPYIPRGFHMGK